METRVKCIYCGKPIHISKFGGVKKEGLFCNETLCIIQLIREEEERLDALSKVTEAEEEA